MIETPGYDVNKKISTAIFIQFAVLTIQYLIIYYFNIEESTIGTIIKVLSKAVVGIFFLRALKDALRREYKLMIMVYSSFIVILLLNVILFPKNIDSIKSIFFEFFIMCLPCFVYSFSIDDYDIFFNVFNKVGNVIFTVGLFISFLILSKKINIGTYSMTLSYYLLIPALIYLYKFLQEISIKYFILFILSLLAILLIGARGPILCIAVYVTFYLLNNVKERNKTKKIILYVIFIMMLFIAIIFMQNILYVINEILKSQNIYSRTIYALLNDKTHLSGREILYSKAIELIKNYPLLGIGVAGDRLYLGAYVHNLFLELILDYGIIIGLLLSVILISLFIKSIFFFDREMSNIILIFFCLGAVPLMISGSYLTSALFWIYIGMSTNLIIKQ